MPGIVIDLLSSADLHDLSGIHNRNPVSSPGHNTQIMGHQNGGSTHLFLYLFQKIQNLCLNGHV